MSEPNDRIHDSSKPEKPSKAEIEELQETIITGVGILNDIASRVVSAEADGISDAWKEGLNSLCAAALSGDQESLATLRDIGREIVLRVGGLGASSSAGGAGVHKSRRAHRAKRQGSKKACSPPREAPPALPDHPVAAVDLPEHLPAITPGEIGNFLQARDSFLRARADYERRRADLVYKLRMLCEPEDQRAAANYLLKLDPDGDTLLITDQSSIPAEVVIDRR